MVHSLYITHCCCSLCTAHSSQKQQTVTFIPHSIAMHVLAKDIPIKFHIYTTAKLVYLQMWCSYANIYDVYKLNAINYMARMLCTYDNDNDKQESHWAYGTAERGAL